jgi:hypothetical protein
MRKEIIDAIVALDKQFSDIDLKLSDIVDISDYDNEVVLHCRNYAEYFEFRLNAVLYSQFNLVNMSVSAMPDSPFSCDTFNASYDLITKEVTMKCVD